MLNDAKNELLEALRARDKSKMSLEELKLYAEILNALSEVSDTSCMDILSDSMKVMMKSMEDAAASLTAPPVGLAYAI